MERLKIVIVSFEMFPVISPRSFRTTELAKELARKGHDVTLYTVWKTDFDYESFGFDNGIKLKNLGSLNLNLTKNLIKKFLNKIIAYPSIKLIPMVKKAIEGEGVFDYLITIAAPHPIHWGAGFVKKRLFNCWVADCGDPYMLNPFAFHPFYFKWFEKNWCSKADFITVPIEAAKEGYYPEFRDKIRVIPQGFDFSSVKLAEYKPNSVPTFAYAGNCYKKGRDITPFLQYLIKLDKPFKFLVYTQSQMYFSEFEESLKDKMEVRGFIPRDQLLKELSKVDFLLNVNNDYAIQSPSKLIDYYLTKRPILSISSKFSEAEAFEQFLKGDYSRAIVPPDISSYDIRNVAQRFVDLYYQL